MLPSPDILKKAQVRWCCWSIHWRRLQRIRLRHKPSGPETGIQLRCLRRIRLSGPQHGCYTQSDCGWCGKKSMTTWLTSRSRRDPRDSSAETSSANWKDFEVPTSTWWNRTGRTRYAPSVAVVADSLPDHDLSWSFIGTLVACRVKTLASSSAVSVASGTSARHR